MNKLSILVVFVGGLSLGAYAADDNAPVSSNDHRAAETGVIDNGAKPADSKAAAQTRTDNSQQQTPVSSNDHRATETSTIDQNATARQSMKKEGDKAPLQEGSYKPESNTAAQSTQKAPDLDSVPTSSSATPKSTR